MLRLQAQNLLSDQLLTASDKLYVSLSQKSSSMEGKLDKKTEKYLSKLQKQEAKLKRKLWNKDTALARQLFIGVEEKYQSLKKLSQSLGKYNSLYSGHLDSLTTALKFLMGQKFSTPKLQKTLSQLSSLQDKFSQTEAIKNFLSERKQLLKENFESLGMLSELKGFQKQAYYYAAQVRQYKELWEGPSKVEKKLMELVLKNDKFKEFFSRNSQLASLFALPGGNTSIASLQGLQTMASVQQSIQNRFGTGPQVQQMISQILQTAERQLSELKNKLSQYVSGSYGNSSSDIDLPVGFRPNTQKTKTFLQRLEYGANIQNQKARNYFPVTSDFGLSLGYKLNDNSSIGVGASYKLGWGKGWNNIRLTNEGIGLRSYVDYKLKGSLYISGGYEQNYRTAFNAVQQLRDYAAWQTSGLIGLSKKYKVSRKLRGELKLLWDFLSYQQIPRTQAVLFRIGYSLK
jgi:hypothetical protein